MNREELEDLIATIYTNDSPIWRVPRSQVMYEPQLNDISVPSSDESQSFLRAQEVASGRAAFKRERYDDQVRWTNSVQSQPSTKVSGTLAQDRSSCSSRYPSSSGYTTDIGTTMAEQPRRYRLGCGNKTTPRTAQRLTQQSCLPEDEPLLARILEQERRAWLTDSPNETSEQPIASFSQTSALWESPVTPSRATTSVVQISESGSPSSTNIVVLAEGAHDNQEEAKKSEIETKEGSKERGGRYSLGYESEIDDYRKVQAIRKSLFVEGSMNQGSRATASTWQLPQPSDSCASSMSSNLTGFDDGLEATPRPSLVGSLSTSSSTIDLNEFKPLPATPYTLKNTVKRIGRILKHNDPMYTQYVSEQDHSSSRKPTRGLRKSISTWKIFNGSESDLESEGTSAPSTHDTKSRKKRPTRTLRSMRFGRSRVMPDMKPSLPGGAVLDDRKRKAEIAYAEHFGTVKKKQKQKQASGPSEFESLPRLIDQSATVRKKASAGITTMQSVNPSNWKGDQASGLRVAVTSCPPTQPGDNNMHVAHPVPVVRHHRSGSRKSDGSLDNDTDRLKQSSRSELEKENQHLRSLLRQSQNEVQLRRNNSKRSTATSINAAESLDHDAGKKGSLPGTDWQIHEDYVAKPGHAASESSRGRCNSDGNEIPGNSVQPYLALNDMPPVPLLPKDLVGRGMLSPATGNAQRASDTATIKRRAPLSRSSDAIELPRPLSMVLECIEDERDEISGVQTMSDARCDRDKGDGRHFYNGTTDDENEPHPKGFTDDVLVHKRTDASKNWQWPEDVF